MRIDEQAWYNIMQIKTGRDYEFAQDIMSSRREFLRLRLKHEPALRNIYLDSARQVGEELKRLSPKDTLMRSHLAQLNKVLRIQSEQIDQRTKDLIKDGLNESIGLGAKPIDNFMIRAIEKAGVGLDISRIKKGFGDVNTFAVEAQLARTRKGLNISDRIWVQSEKAREVMRDIVQTGIAIGRDPVEIARDLEQYVQKGVLTLAEEYPNMMERMGRKRIPKDLCYEGLRLARTEYSIAFSEGVYSRGSINPAYEGIQWLLSDAHPEPDICDDLAEADLYGLGSGVYKAGNEPVHPHPNCLCYQIPVTIDTDSFVQDLIEWERNPSSHPYLEDWYQDIYMNLPY